MLSFLIVKEGGWPLKWHHPEQEFDRKQIFQQIALGMFILQLFESCQLSFESNQTDLGKDFCNADGPNLRRFTRQMAGFEWQIRHETVIQTSFPCGFSISTCWQLVEMYKKVPWLNSVRAREGSLSKKLSLGGILSAMRFGPKNWYYFVVSSHKTWQFDRRSPKVFPKIIERTLPFGKYLLIYSLFNAISRVNWKRDSTFRFFTRFFSHWQNRTIFHTIIKTLWWKIGIQNSHLKSNLITCV